MVNSGFHDSWWWLFLWILVAWCGAGTMPGPAPHVWWLKQSIFGDSGMVYYCCNHNILISLIYEPHIWQDNWEPYGNHAIIILIMGWNGHMTIFHHLFCDLGVSEHRGKKHAHPTKKCHIIRPHDLDLFIGSHKKNQNSRQLTCLVGGLNPSEKY